MASKETLRSPWLTVTLAITAMSMMYLSYAYNTGSIASAERYSCPMHTECATELCGTKGCPDCQGATS